MSAMTFQINDASASGTNPAVWVTISENADGSLAFNVRQEGGIIGDLRGLFFDMADESILKSLTVRAQSTDIRIGDDSIRDLGDGANMNGLLGGDKGYDVGIEVGTAGIGKDDIQGYSFSLSSTLRPLTLQDFSNVDFGARLTSVGVVGGSRSDSSKILEATSVALDLDNVAATVDENDVAGGSVLQNLNTAGSTVVTGWSSGSGNFAAGDQVSLDSEGDLIGTLRLNADGSYVLDASGADELSAGEEIVYNFNFSARNQDEATSWSTDSAGFTVTVVGKNDGPEAGDDDAGRIAEDGAASGSVLGNDSDVDRLDTLSVSAVNGQEAGSVVTLASGATVVMNADGSYTYDTNGAFDALDTGESATDSFEYTISDGHGGFDTATVTVAIDGVSDPVEPPPPPPVADNYPTMAQDISNVVLYLDDGDTSTGILKVKLQPTGLHLKDIDQLNIDQFIATHGAVVGANTDMVGISIHAGQEYPNLAGTDMTAQGEGVFYLLDDGTPIAAVGTRNGGWSSDWSKDDIPLTQAALDIGLSYPLLGQQAQIMYSTLDQETGLWTA